MRKTGNIIWLNKRDHARASMEREANDASRSADTPERFAVLVPSNDFHHSDGIRSRCHHLRTADAGAPTSVARSSSEDQSEMMERNESTMSNQLGQIVLNDKANVSRDCGTVLGDDGFMGKKLSDAEGRAAFIRRTREAREARFSSQSPILVILDLEQGTYKQYETRTPLPYRYIPKFCAATGVSIEWLLTGEGQGPEIRTHAEPLRPKKRSRAS
jgi:hypothetical protein